MIIIFTFTGELVSVITTALTKYQFLRPYLRQEFKCYLYLKLTLFDLNIRNT